MQHSQVQVGSLTACQQYRHPGHTTRTEPSQSRKWTLTGLAIGLMTNNGDHWRSNRDLGLLSYTMQLTVRCVQLFLVPHVDGLPGGRALTTSGVHGVYLGRDASQCRGEGAGQE